jgi:hypothetical protein
LFGLNDRSVLDAKKPISIDLLTEFQQQKSYFEELVARLEFAFTALSTNRHSSMPEQQSFATKLTEYLMCAEIGLAWFTVRLLNHEIKSMRAARRVEGSSARQSSLAAIKLFNEGSAAYQFSMKELDNAVQGCAVENLGFDEDSCQRVGANNFVSFNNQVFKIIFYLCFYSLLFLFCLLSSCVDHQKNAFWLHPTPANPQEGESSLQQQPPPSETASKPEQPSSSQPEASDQVIL